MLFDFLRSLLVFHGVALGLAWPLAVRLRLAPLERLVASAALSLVGAFLLGWTIYVFGLPAQFHLLLPATAAAGLFLGRRALAETWRDPDARAAMIGYLLVTGWCVGWLATVASYSGGGWAGDWLEHWQRAEFFLVRGPLDERFISVYPLTARPPLVNVVTAGLLWLTEADFAHYQLLSTLLACLVFLPAALLARRFAGAQGGPRVIAVLTVLFLVSPLVVENATFAWTKLPTACLVLAALYFFLRAREADAPRGAAPLWAVLLAAALLAHYSAGPYAVVLAAAWLAFPNHRRDPAWWRATGLATALGGALLAVWFGWALAKYGVAGTFLSNTSVTEAGSYDGSQWLKVALNLRDTFIPHFLRHPDESLIAQTNAFGRVRDAWFLCYQLNLPLAFGSVAWLALLRELYRLGRASPRRVAGVWTLGIAAVIFLGVATHGARDAWGLTHICLQALILLGLAFLAARWEHLGPSWRLALIAGATVDVVTGIALQFGIQSFRLIQWTSGGRPLAETIPTLSEITGMNLITKFRHRALFFGEVFDPPLALVMLLLAVLLVMALARTARPGRAFARPMIPPAPPPMRARDLPLEGLRGLCAGAVFFAHAFAPNTVLDPRWAPPAQFWWFNFGYAAVMVFFTLSGYVIGLTTTEEATGPAMRRYLGRRALRLLPINTFAVLLAWALLPEVGRRAGFGNLLLLQNSDPYPGGVNFPLLPNNNPLWSLNYEAVCYLGFLVVWLTRPSRGLAWGTLLVLALLSAAGLPAFAIFSHWAGGGLFWLAGLAIAWETVPADGARRGNWPAALLGIVALWQLAPLRLLINDLGWFPLLGLTPAAPHRFDFLIATAWLVLAVTGRAPRLQRGLTWLCILWSAVGLGLHFAAGPFGGLEYIGAAALVGMIALHRWQPEATLLTRLAPLGLVSFAFYAISLPLQLGQRRLWPEFSGSPLTFAVRFVLLLAFILTLAWWLECRLAPWLRQRFLGAPAANFPRETQAPLNPVR